MSFDCLYFDDVIGFEWDSGNIYKNFDKHGISWQEIEEIFFNEPLLIQKDIKHSQNEERCFVLGKTDSGIKLFVAFTKRDKKIRAISARKMTKKEKAIYEKVEKTS
jgi:uncharacterized DUF497 family protein